MDKIPSATTTFVDPHLDSDDVRTNGAKAAQDVEKGDQNAPEFTQIPAAAATDDEIERELSRDQKEQPSDSQDELEFPDGGWRAWSVCLGVCLSF